MILKAFVYQTIAWKHLCQNSLKSKCIELKLMLEQFKKKFMSDLMIRIRIYDKFLGFHSDCYGNKAVVNRPRLGKIKKTYPPLQVISYYMANFMPRIKMLSSSFGGLECKWKLPTYLLHSSERSLKKNSIEQQNHSGCDEHIM